MDSVAGCGIAAASEAAAAISACVSRMVAARGCARQQAAGCVLLQACSLALEAIGGGNSEGARSAADSVVAAALAAFEAHPADATVRAAAACALLPALRLAAARPLLALQRGGASERSRSVLLQETAAVLLCDPATPAETLLRCLVFLRAELASEGKAAAAVATGRRGDGTEANCVGSGSSIAGNGAASSHDGDAEGREVQQAAGGAVKGSTGATGSAEPQAPPPLEGFCHPTIPAALVAAMGRHSGDERTQAVACAALEAAALTGPSAAAQLLAAGAVEAVVAAMVQHPRAQLVQLHAAKAALGLIIQQHTEGSARLLHRTGFLLAAHAALRPTLFGGEEVTERDGGEEDAARARPPGQMGLPVGVAQVGAAVTGKARAASVDGGKGICAAAFAPSAAARLDALCSVIVLAFMSEAPLPGVNHMMAFLFVKEEAAFLRAALLALRLGIVGSGGTVGKGHAEETALAGAAAMISLAHVAGSLQRLLLEGHAAALAARTEAGPPMEIRSAPPQTLARQRQIGSGSGSSSGAGALRRSAAGGRGRGRSGGNGGSHSRARDRQECMASCPCLGRLKMPEKDNFMSSGGVCGPFSAAAALGGSWADEKGGDSAAGTVWR